MERYIEGRMKRRSKERMERKYGTDERYIEGRRGSVMAGKNAAVLLLVSSLETS